MDISMEKLNSLLTVSEVAELHEVPARVVRKAAKAGTVPGQINVLSKFGFDPELVIAWVPPEPGTRVVGARRADGRQRYYIYCNKDEKAKLLAEGFDLTDPREAAKARRAARKAKEGTTPAEASVEVEGEDPFADFNV